VSESGKYVSERELNEKAVAPRVTLDALEANIMAEVYFTGRDGLHGKLAYRAEHAAGDTALDGVPAQKVFEILGLTTYCVLILKNGFTVTGKSACASPENYDEDIGNRVARGDAIRQVWGFMGYGLREQLHQVEKLRGHDDQLGEALTRMTAFGLGNENAFRRSDADRILTHFIQDKGEEGGRTYSDLGNRAIETAVERTTLPVTCDDPEPLDLEPGEAAPVTAQEEQLEPDEQHLIERNELGAAHPAGLEEPTINEEEVR
jgi:hypothetical protein